MSKRTLDATSSQACLDEAVRRAEAEGLLMFVLQHRLHGHYTVNSKDNFTGIGTKHWQIAAIVEPDGKTTLL